MIGNPAGPSDRHRARPSYAGILRWLVFAAVLASVTPAIAGEMLLYGPGVPSPDSAARAEAVLRAATDRDAPSGGTSHVLDLPFPSEAPVWMAGDLLQLPCGDPSLASVDPAAIVAEGTELVDELSYDKALLRLEEGLRALPCSESPVDRKTLTDLYFFLGLAEFEEGSKSKAKRAFASALAIDPDKPWDNDYPPDPQALYDEAAGELQPAPTVGFDVRGAGITEFRVDGQAIDVGAARALDLRRGKHLIQYTTEAGDRVSTLVNVGRDGGDFVSRDALRTSVLNLAWKPVTARAAEGALADLGRSRGVDDVFVVLLGDGDEVARAYRFGVSAAEVVPLNIDPQAVARELKPAGPAPLAGDDPGRVGIAIGGGLHIGNVHPYGLVTVRGQFRLVAGLELDVGLYLAATSAELEGDGDGEDPVATYVLPGALFGARYRFNPNAAHPYLGVRGVITASNLEDTDAARAGTESATGPAGGGGFNAGIDITPGGARGFFVNVDFLVGYWKLASPGGGLLVDVTAGVGVRF